MKVYFLEIQCFVSSLNLEMRLHFMASTLKQKLNFMRNFREKTNSKLF